MPRGGFGGTEVEQRGSWRGSVSWGCPIEGLGGEEIEGGGGEEVWEGGGGSVSWGIL